MRKIRLGISGKLLSFYGFMIALIFALEIGAQAAAYRSSREYEERLTRYHAIHRLRVALFEHRNLGERYLRELGSDQLASLRDDLIVLGQMAEELEPYGAESLEAYFEVRAARRGIEAYLPLSEAAFEKRVARHPDYYTDFAKSQRIAAYIDGYLSKLLSLSLQTGESRYREMASKASLYRKAALGGFLGMGGLSLVFAAFFASSIAAPIRRLAAASERLAAGDLAVEPVTAGTGDEVEILARGFNAMAANIKTLIEGLREKAELERRLHDEELALVTMGRALREAQFMNLQDQMRPHFLFNAINAISRTALLEGAAQTERLALGLGRLMRYALHPGGAFVSLDEELEVIREYLAFQSIRFGRRLLWEVGAEEPVRGLLIPRFTLQPLVENAVRHGIEPKEEGGFVRVSARRHFGRTRIVVVDSGVGMERALLRRLRSTSSAEAGIKGRAECSRPEPIVPGEGGIGFGLGNLELRLAFRYGKGARVALASSLGRGTVVRISIPREGAIDA